MRGTRTFLRTGRLWYQKVFVGGFMRSRLPCASSSFTGSICLQLCFPRASLCLKMKSRAAPMETEAMEDRGSSSFSSSRCSPMWSCPSLYLVDRFLHSTLNWSQPMSYGSYTFLTCWPRRSWMSALLPLWQHHECIPTLESMGRPNVLHQNRCKLNLRRHTLLVSLVYRTPFQTPGPLLLALKNEII